MQRAGVLGVAAQHVLGERDDLGRALVRPAVGHPVAPRPQVHHRLDVEHGDVEVGGELLVHGAHRVGVSLVVGRAVVGAARVALGQRVDERALTRRGPALERLRLLNQLVGVRLLVGLHHRVDVGAEDQRLAPVGDGQVGIEPRRLAEGPARLGVVEGVGQVQALVDEALHRRLGRADREGVRPEVLQPRRQLAVGAGLAGLGGRFVVLVGGGGRRGDLRGGPGTTHQRDDAGDECDPRELHGHDLTSWHHRGL